MSYFSFTENKIYSISQLGAMLHLIESSRYFKEITSENHITWGGAQNMSRGRTE